MYQSGGAAQKAASGTWIGALPSPRAAPPSSRSAMTGLVGRVTQTAFGPHDGECLAKPAAPGRGSRGRRAGGFRSPWPVRLRPPGAGRQVRRSRRCRAPRPSRPGARGRRPRSSGSSRRWGAAPTRWRRAGPPGQRAPARIERGATRRRRAATASKRQRARYPQETGRGIGQPGHEQHHAAVAVEKGVEREGRGVADGEAAADQDPGQH